MNRKILILAIVTFSLAVCGCQELPPTPNTQNYEQKAESNLVHPENKTSKIDNTLPITTTPPPEPKHTEPEPPKVVSPATQTEKQKIKVTAYFPDDAGINLVAVKRTIEIKDDAEKYLAVLNLLINSPTEKDLTAIFPKNTKINSVNFKDGTAFVDFDKNITKSFAGGSTGEELLVNSVVKTLTEFPEVQQVRFLVDGKEIETLSGHMDLSEPIKKSDV